MKTLWNIMGDIRVAFVLLMAASATLFTGAFYAGGNFSLFMELNRQRIQDWLPVQLVERFDVVWWIPLLFVVMGLLGINTFICATNRVVRLIRQRHDVSTGRLLLLSIPSLVHFLFLLIMIGHLITFTIGRWQTLPLSAGRSVTIDPAGKPYQVEAVDHRFFADASALSDRIAQTTAALVAPGGQPLHLQYTRPVYRDGHFFLLDKIKKNRMPSRKPRIEPSATDQSCNKAHFKYWIFIALVVGFMGSQPGAWAAADDDQTLEAIAQRIAGLVPNPDYKDDRVGILVVRQALISLKEGSGGIGACLVDETSGKVVATGRNRQFRPYFRSDLHAEMDLLTRYEDWLRKKGGKGSAADPRDCNGLVLVSSVEPCPMCLTRIINAGIKKMVYVTPDEHGGMVRRMDQLPPFWKTRAAQCEYRPAVCSPKVQQLARDLFDYTTRDLGMKKEGRK